MFVSGSGPGPSPFSESWSKSFLKPTLKQRSLQRIEFHTSSHKGVLDGGSECPLSTHLGTKHHPFVTAGTNVLFYTLTEAGGSNGPRQVAGSILQLQLLLRKNRWHQVEE